jgi:hypothetical protein
MSWFSISNIRNIITIHVFHNHYYDDIAQVKCSLSRSNGDLNRFLTSWWFLLHTNHTHRSNELQVTERIILIKSWVRQASPYLGATRLPRIRYNCPWPHYCAPMVTATSSNTVRTSGQFLVQIVSRLHDRNDLSFQLNVGHAFNMTWGTYNGTVLNRHRQNHYSPKSYKTPPGLHLSINTWLFLWYQHIVKVIR